MGTLQMFDTELLGVSGGIWRGRRVSVTAPRLSLLHLGVPTWSHRPRIWPPRSRRTSRTPPDEYVGSRRPAPARWADPDVHARSSLFSVQSLHRQVHTRQLDKKRSASTHGASSPRARGAIKGGPWSIRGSAWPRRENSSLRRW